MSCGKTHARTAAGDDDLLFRMILKTSVEWCEYLQNLGVAGILPHPNPSPAGRGAYTPFSRREKGWG
jgi:hypothetical protein